MKLTITKSSADVAEKPRDAEFCRIPFVFHVIAKDGAIGLLRRAAMLCAVLSIALLSARHRPVLCQNE